MAQDKTSLRTAILGATHRQSKIVSLFGEDVEIRQASFGEVMDNDREQNAQQRAAMLLVRHCFVPGTDEHVFEDTDVDALLQLPFGKDLQQAQKAITEMLGIDIAGAEKNSETNRIST